MSHYKGEFLWSLRYFPAHGWVWHMERTVTADTRNEWLALHQKDEPDTEFCLAAKQPKTNRINSRTFAV